MEQLTAPSTRWTNAQLVLFRFFFAFFLLYIFFNPNGVIPGSDIAYNFYIRPFHRLIPWIGQHILHLAKPVTQFTNGSGDTSYDNLILAFLTLLAILTCLIWTLTDRKRPSYKTLFYWLTVILRYYLALTMLVYGYSKVFKHQFPNPTLYRLTESYGESSPMGLAWTFMGYSAGYNLFTGLAEVTAAVLLFFRRTTAIGALLAFIVSANIMAMNYCFDIPVKLLSTMMVLMSLFLLGNNIRRLFGLFFLGRSVGLSAVPRPPIRKKAFRITLLVAKTLLLLYAVVGYGISVAQSVSKNGDRAPRTPLCGIYNCRVFIHGKDTLPPLETDTIRWKQLVIDGPKDDPYSTLKMMNDKAYGYAVKTDTVNRLLTISDWNDSAKRWQLHYSFPAKDSLVLWGSRLWGKETDTIRVSLVRYPADRYLLNRRGFNWINEFPYDE